MSQKGTDVISAETRFQQTQKWATTYRLTRENVVGLLRYAGVPVRDDADVFFFNEECNETYLDSDNFLCVRCVTGQEHDDVNTTKIRFPWTAGDQEEGGDS